MAGGPFLTSKRWGKATGNHCGRSQYQTEGIEMKKIALVTGGARDIGRGIVERVAATHAAVAVHANASVDQADEIVEALTRSNVEAKAFRADLGLAKDVDRMFDDFDAWVAGLGPAYRFTTLVNNSAVAKASPLGATDVETVNAIVEVNVKGTFRVTTAAASRLADGGRIVSVSMDTHAVFSPDFALFTATKAAVEALTRHWAAGLGPRGITVNAVGPGVVEVNFRAEMLNDADFRSGLEGATALGRVGRVEDVVDVVDFLLSDAARWITGQVLVASGGWRL